MKQITELRPFGYYILQKHQYKDYPNGTEFKPSYVGWIKSSKRFYHTKEIAESAVKDMEKLLMYNGEWIKTEFKIIELFSNE